MTVRQTAQVSLRCHGRLFQHPAGGYRSWSPRLTGVKMEHRGPTWSAQPSRRPWYFASVVTLFIVAGVLIFCHGCHSGDHDDELCLPAVEERY